jgi:hypothetical protein
MAGVGSHDDSPSAGEKSEDLDSEDDEPDMKKEL